MILKLSASRATLGLFIYLLTVFAPAYCLALNNHDLNQIIQSAEKGDVQAQYLLGSIYLLGDDVKKDKNLGYQGEPQQKNFKKAVKWLKKAARQGHVFSQFRLGGIYETQWFSGNVFDRSNGLKADSDAAIYWYRQAAKKGHKPSKDRMTYLMRFKIGVLQKKAESGGAEAQCNLGRKYLSFGMDTGNQKYYREAMKWFKKAADQGFPEAQYRLGNMYSSVKDKRKNNAGVKAVHWYRKAAVNGHAEAQYRLGSILCKGRYGVPEDDAKGIEWCEKAAYQGHILALKEMGGMYLSGENVPKDIVKAYSWYSVAVEKRRGGKYFEKYLQKVMKEMTSEQIAEGRKQAEILFKKIQKNNY